MARVLYISYTGLLDPLGQSQVLQYLLSLTQRHSITLLTFEKPENLADTRLRTTLAERCKTAGLIWHARTWHNRPSIPATIYDIILGISTATRLAREARAEIVHCRSYIGGMIGLAVTRRTGARLIFDMRGFWPDERVDGGSWSRNGLPYKFFKRVERSLFLNADHVVSLTRSGAKEISNIDYLQGRMPQVSVIPTCANLDLFYQADAPRTGFTLGYVGSIGHRHMFEDVAKTVRRLFELRSDSRFLVLNKGNHAQIRTDLRAAGVDLDRVELLEAPFDQVASHIARMDAGIFFVRPAWSTRATCPTRMGEFLSCGKPCLASEGVGDVREDLTETGTGITLPVDDSGRLVVKDLDKALEQLMSMASDPEVAGRCRAAAEQRFSLRTGVNALSQIYQSLAQQESQERPPAGSRCRRPV